MITTFRLVLSPFSLGRAMSGFHHFRKLVPSPFSLGRAMSGFHHFRKLVLSHFFLGHVRFSSLQKVSAVPFRSGSCHFKTLVLSPFSLGLAVFEFHHIGKLMLFSACCCHLGGVETTGSWHLLMFLCHRCRIFRHCSGEFDITLKLAYVTCLWPKQAPAVALDSSLF